jgi:hypothetical protein
MVLNPILLGGVWFIIHRYSVFHTFIWRRWVGGLSQMKLTSFEKNCHILRRSLIYLKITDTVFSSLMSVPLIVQFNSIQFKVLFKVDTYSIHIT